METKILFLTTVMIFILNTRDCVGLWCFDCDTYTESRCGDDFSVTTGEAEIRKQCYGSCLKRRGKDRDGSVSRTVVDRSCTSYKSEGCYSENWNNLNMKTCVCNTDFCNTSSSFDKVILSITVTLSALLAIFKNKYLR